MTAVASQAVVYDATITIETETHITGSGPLEELARIEKTRLKWGSSCSAVDIACETRYKDLVDEILRIREKIGNATFLPLPRLYYSDGRAVVYIPGSAVKGVLRALLDQYGIDQALQNLDPERVEELEGLRQELGCSVEDFGTRAALINEYSHATLSTVCEKLYTLSAFEKRRKLVEKVEEVLGGRRHLKHYLGLSELLFGTTGLRSSIYVTDFLPDGDVHTYVKVFISVARGKVANPYHLEFIPPGTKFRGRIIFKPTPLVTEQDLESFFNALNNKGNLKREEGQYVITAFLGRRKKLGHGKATITITRMP
jgi:CRISPR/Cas system CSM-associated protein Csm3 (group 7 of RAMP superfamily)